MSALRDYIACGFPAGRDDALFELGLLERVHEAALEVHRAAKWAQSVGPRKAHQAQGRLHAATTELARTLGNLEYERRRMNTDGEQSGAAKDPV